MKKANINIEKITVKQGLKLLDEWKILSEYKAKELKDLDYNIQRLRKIIRGKRK